MGAYLKYFPNGTELPKLEKIDKLKEALKDLVIPLNERPMSFRNIPKDKLLCVTQMHPTHDALAVIYDEREWDVKCRPYSDQNDREYALIDLETVVNCCLLDGGLDIRPHLDKTLMPGTKYPGIPVSPVKGYSVEVFYRKGYAKSYVFFAKDNLNGLWIEVMDIEPSTLNNFLQGWDNVEAAFPDHSVYEREILLTGVPPWTFEKATAKASAAPRKKLPKY